MAQANQTTRPGVHYRIHSSRSEIPPGFCPRPLQAEGLRIEGGGCEEFPWRENCDSLMRQLLGDRDG